MKIYSFFKRAIASFVVAMLVVSMVPAQALAETTPTITITSPTEGQVLTSSSATFTFSVANVTVGVGSDHVHYYLDNNSVVMVYSTDSITLSDLSEGSHTLRAVVADANHTEYTNAEATTTVNFTVDLTHPDLVIDDISLDDSDTITVKVSNQGNENVTTTDGKTYIYIDGSLDWTYSWTTLSDQGFLNFGDSATIQPQTLTGTHTVKACVDATNVVDESNEDNNCSEVTLTAGTDSEDSSDDDVSSDVDLGAVAGDFASTSGYDAPKVVVVRWGVLDPTVAADSEEDGSSTTQWDGSFSVSNGLMHLDHAILFEHKKQHDKVTAIRDTNHKPDQISFNSTIGPHYDGLMARYRAATGEDPVFTFTTAYDSLSVSVAESTLENGAYTYDAGNGYGVWIGLVNQDQLQNPFFPKGGLFEIRYGNLNGSVSTDATTYTNTLALSGEGSLKVLNTYLFENQQGDSVTTSEGSTIAWTSVISGHWDSILVEFVPPDVADDSNSDRGLTLTMNNFSQTFSSKDDFGVFDIGDGTGNQVQVTNFMGNAAEVHDQFVEAKLDLAADLADFATALQNAQDGNYSSDLLTQLQEIYDNLSAYNFVPGTYGLAQHAVVQLTNALNRGDSETEITALLAKLKAEYENAKENARKRKFALGLLAFKDVDDDGDSWYHDYVDHLITLGILSGYKDENGNALGEFRPSWNITYAEALKIVLLATGHTVQSGDPDNSSADASWAKDYVYTAEHLGLSVVDDASLDINTQITRGEFVQLILEALSVDPGSYSSYSFPDINGNAHAAYIQYAYAQGIVSGNPDGNFYPDKSINRAEAAKIMSKVIELYSLDAVSAS